MSPLLFNLFIDDLAETLNHEEPIESINSLLFADDIQILANSQETLQRRLDVTTSWVKANYMEVNIGKCGIIGQTGNAFTLCDVMIPHVSTYKYLGFPHTKSGIDFLAHFDRFAKKALAILHFCMRAGNHWAPATRLTIFKAFIQPSLEYGAPLLDNFLLPPVKEKVFETLQMIQNKCINWIVPFSSSLRATSIVCAIADIKTRFSGLSALFVEHLNRRSADNPARLSIGLTPPYVLQLILPRSMRHLVHARLNTLKTGDISLHTLIKKWTLEQIVAGSRLGIALENKCRKPRYGPDSTIKIENPDTRTMAIQWRTNSLFARRTCPAGHPFVKTCILQHLPLSLVHVPHHTGCPNYCLLDELLNRGEYQRFQKIVNVVETFLE